MKNFQGTEWEHLTEEEIFLQNQKYVLATIEKRFPNHKQFCKAHMIEYDDLVQMGNIGLLNAIRTYDPQSSNQFLTHAINSIFWEIATQSKTESLRNVNTQTFEIVNMVSADAEIKIGFSDDEELNILGTIAIPPSQETSEIANDNILFNQVIEFLKNDSEMTPDLLLIFINLLQGENCSTIAKQVGAHRNTVIQKLGRKKAMRIKNRLYKFLRDEKLLMNGAN